MIADGADREARGECLVAAWLAGVVLAAGTGLQHKLAHVLGGLGLPHAETHAVILPHVTRFNLAAAPAARGRGSPTALGDDPPARLAAMLRGFPIPQRLSDVGFERGRIESSPTRSRRWRSRCRGRFPPPTSARCWPPHI